jgi:hypothetical protein
MRHFTSLAAVFAIGLATGGCTLAKPIVGAVTGPAMILGNSGGNWNCGGDGRGLVAVLMGCAFIGAGAGLVTGVISDVQFLCGYARNPTHNWWNPFATNTWNG